jgi:hypothetical protein
MLSTQSLAPDFTLTEYFDLIRRTTDLAAPGWKRVSLVVEFQGADDPDMVIPVAASPSASVPRSPQPSRGASQT